MLGDQLQSSILLQLASMVIKLNSPILCRFGWIEWPEGAFTVKTAYELAIGSQELIW